MNTLKIVRYTAWALVALLGLGIGAVATGWFTGERAGTPVASVGGPFTLVDHQGSRVSEGDFRGKPSLFFFGFTHCPDVCPTTLVEATGWLDALGKRADRLNVAFVSVDPERDTAAVLADYMKSFDPRIRGLTGTPEEVAAILKAYRVYARKVPVEAGGYTMDHTATVYLLDAEGRFTGTISYQEPKEQALAKLRRLIG